MAQELTSQNRFDTVVFVAFLLLWNNESAACKES